MVFEVCCFVLMKMELNESEKAPFEVMNANKHSLYNKHLDQPWKQFCMDTCPYMYLSMHLKVGTGSEELPADPLCFIRKTSA